MLSPVSPPAGAGPSRGRPECARPLTVDRAARLHASQPKDKGPERNSEPLFRSRMDHRYALSAPGIPFWVANVAILLTPLATSSMLSTTNMSVVQESFVTVAKL